MGTRHSSAITFPGRPAQRASVTQKQADLNQAITWVVATLQVWCQTGAAAKSQVIRGMITWVWQVIPFIGVCVTRQE